MLRRRRRLPRERCFPLPRKMDPAGIFLAAGRLFHASLWSNPNNVHTSFQPGEPRGHLLLVGALFANWSEQSPCLLPRASRSSCLLGCLRVQGVGRPVLVPGRGAVGGGQGPFQPGFQRSASGGLPTSPCPPGQQRHRSCQGSPSETAQLGGGSKASRGQLSLPTLQPPPIRHQRPESSSL